MTSLIAKFRFSIKKPATNHRWRLNVVQNRHQVKVARVLLSLREILVSWVKYHFPDDVVTQANMGPVCVVRVLGSISGK